MTEQLLEYPTVKCPAIKTRLLKWRLHIWGVALVSSCGLAVLGEGCRGVLNWKV